MDRLRIRAIYDERAPNYDRSIGFGERLVLGDFRRAFAAELRGETLEVAIGTGLNLPFYPETVSRAVGIDLSRGMLMEAQARVAEMERTVVLSQMDAQQLAFPDASFDTVAVSLSLCTVLDPEAVLMEVARVCRPDGRVVLLEHVQSPVRLVALGQRVLSPAQERFIGCSLVRETMDTARMLGFTIESERRRLLGVFRLVVAKPPAPRVGMPVATPAMTGEAS